MLTKHHSVPEWHRMWIWEGGRYLPLTQGAILCLAGRVGSLEDLVVLGAPVSNPVETARFIDRLALAPVQKARLLRQYLRESQQRLSTEVLVAARNYSFYL